MACFSLIYLCIEPKRLYPDQTYPHLSVVDTLDGALRNAYHEVTGERSGRRGGAFAFVIHFSFIFHLECLDIPSGLRQLTLAQPS